eukprot:540679_1
MAYWLGFLFADGNVHKQPTSIWRVRLGLKCIDYGHVEKFKTALQSTYKLSLYKTNFGTCAAVHSISNNSLATSLIQLGCIPRKSLTLEWPNNIPDEFVHHFVRGYCDGDGCIRFDKQSGSFNVTILGSPSFIIGLQNYIKQNVLSNLKAKGGIFKHESHMRLIYSGSVSP